MGRDAKRNERMVEDIELAIPRRSNIASSDISIHHSNACYATESETSTSPFLKYRKRDYIRTTATSNRVWTKESLVAKEDKQPVGRVSL